MRQAEIGSEYEYPVLPEAAGQSEKPERSGTAEAAFGCIPGDSCLTFTGRGALELVLKEAGVRGRALLPAWCCESMVEPFQRCGLEVSLYPVEPGPEGLHLRLEQIPEDCRVLLWCGYFGFGVPALEAQLLRRFRERGGLVVFDFTHSLLSENPIPEGCDYAAASLRKALPLLSGGLAVSLTGPLKNRPAEKPEEDFLSLREQAMRRKRAFVQAGYQGDKDSFLPLYARANGLLRETAYGRGMDETSRAMLGKLNLRQIAARRRENARVLYQQLQGIDGLRFVFPESQMQAPLFVPVLLSRQRRDAVRQALIRQGIFCPVHWPGLSLPGASEIPERELSLICDQRYGAEEMAFEAQVLREALADTAS